MSLLRDDPILLVFVVAAVGYLAGRVRIGGFGFGVAAVLFAGLAFGMADAELKVPPRCGRSASCCSCTPSGWRPGPAS